MIPLAASASPFIRKIRALSQVGALDVRARLPLSGRVNAEVIVLIGSTPTWTDTLVRHHTEQLELWGDHLLSEWNPNDEVLLKRTKPTRVPSFE
jgi:hypothetical protein